MMAGNPNWWSMNSNSMHPQSFQQQLSVNPQLHHHRQFVYGSSNVVADSSSADNRNNPFQDFPDRSSSSLSQLLLGGLGSEEDRYGASLFQQQKKLENWEADQVLNLNPYSNSLTRSNNIAVVDEDVKHNDGYQLYDDQNHDVMVHHNSSSSSATAVSRSCNSNNTNWPFQHQRIIPTSSPTSCVTTLNNSNFLDLSGGNKRLNKGQHQHNQEHSSECNSTSNGGVSKKAKVQQSSAQPAMKVRKEKLGDRITALHQIVSPFGKTDTASVLSEAIGYIRFLHGQIEALSAPYIRNASAAASSTSHHLHSHELGREGVMKDLRSKGLCLVPISCTQNVCNNDSGADYWAPSSFGGGF